MRCVYWIILSPLYDFAYAFVEFLYDCMYTYIYIYVCYVIPCYADCGIRAMPFT